MNKIKTTLVLLVCLVLVLAAGSFAQQAKIAIVNSQKAFEQSIEGKKAQTQLQERETKIRTDLQKLDDSIKALESKLSAGQLTMTQEALLALKADYDKKTTERKRYEEDMTKDNQTFTNNIISRVRNEMVTVINDIRKEKGYDLVLDLQSSGIITYDTAIDITDEVIKRYDAQKTAAASAKTK